MRRLLSTAVLIIFALLTAHASALGLEDAWRSAPARPDAITTRLELLTASNKLVRVEADPLALRMDLLQANQGVELLEAQHRHALFTALLEVAEAYTGVLQGRAQAELAGSALALSETALMVANIRFDNGGATSFDVRDAEIAVEEARQAVEAATSGLDVAGSNLEGMIGSEVDPAELEPVHDGVFVVLPDLEVVVANLDDHPTLLQARQGVALARTGVELLDPAYASEAQIESAKTQLRTAEELVGEARRGFALQARNAYLQASTSADRHTVAAERVAAAEERLALQRARLEGGLISRIELDRVALEVRQQHLELLGARHEHLLALLRLQAATMHDLGLAPAVTAVRR
ncbi:MAG TPA: TolC family protein [Trueperaceae bacterium]|nr:TolC family protein [Trueperaceae bacterium]